MGRRINRPQPLAQLVGVNVREIRVRRGLSRARLEALTVVCGYRVPHRAIGEMEAGRNSDGVPRSVTVDELVVLARALRVTPADLMTPGYRPSGPMPGRSTSTRKP